MLGFILAYNIGFPNREKVNKVLKSYKAQNQLLVRAFYQMKLIAAIGLEVTDSSIVIKRINVAKLFRRKRIGKAMVYYVIEKLALKEIFLETDHEDLSFYSNIGFKCKIFFDRGNLRYKCIPKL